MAAGQQFPRCWPSSLHARITLVRPRFGDAILAVAHVGRPAIPGLEALVGADGSAAGPRHAVQTQVTVSAVQLPVAGVALHGAALAHTGPRCGDAIIAVTHIGRRAVSGPDAAMGASGGAAERPHTPQAWGAVRLPLAAVALPATAVDPGISTDALIWPPVDRGRRGGRQAHFVGVDGLADGPAGAAAIKGVEAELGARPRLGDALADAELARAVAVGGAGLTDIGADEAIAGADRALEDATETVGAVAAATFTGAAGR